jgi:small subunit ribosomal protein S9
LIDDVDPESVDSDNAPEETPPEESNDSGSIESSVDTELPGPGESADEPVAEPVAEEEPAPAAEAERPPVAEAEPPAAAAEPVAEEEPEPVAEEKSEPVAEESSEPAAEESSEPAAEESAAVPEVEIEEIEIEVQPRVKPEIPGADLIPDIVPEGVDLLSLDAEARAAAEAEAEEARGEDGDRDEDAKPIADAAIDLAAGARYRATGKRKTAVARVILKPGTGVYLVNGKTLEVFFPRPTLERVIRQPLETVGYEARMDVVAKLHGGGVSAQAGALRHGISRALIEADPNLRGELKRRGFLTRDPRVKERKKAGLKKARKRPQFSKR